MESLHKVKGTLRGSHRDSGDSIKGNDREPGDPYSKKGMIGSLGIPRDPKTTLLGALGILKRGLRGALFPS